MLELKLFDQGSNSEMVHNVMIRGKAIEHHLTRSNPLYILLKEQASKTP